jgi:hypothetical protein
MLSLLDVGDMITQGTFNDVLVQQHVSRHQPGGLDPLQTSIPIDITNFTDTEGSSSFFARSDHQHSHGFLVGDNLHSVSTISSPGFMSAQDKIFMNSATSLAVVNTLVVRDSLGSDAFGYAAIEIGNLSTIVKSSSNIVSNYNIILPTTDGSTNLILSSYGNSESFWGSSPFSSLTLESGDLIVRNSTNLETLQVPQNSVFDGANLQYVLTSNANLFPSWVIPTLNPFYGFTELTDFTGSNAPFAETNWRTNATINTLISDDLPTSNTFYPIGCVSLSVNANAARILMTKGSTNQTTNTMSFTTDSSVFFETAVSVDNFNLAAGDVIICELGFSNARSVGVVGTEITAFRFPTTAATGTNVPIQFITTSAGSTTTGNLGTILAFTWTKLKFIVYGRTQLQAYINDVLVYTMNPLTNFPASTTRLSPYVLIRRTGSTNPTRTCVVDYIHWGQFFANGRYP